MIVEVYWPDGLGALIKEGAADREPKDRGATGYILEELRESTTSFRWLECLVEGNLVVDGLTPSPGFVSCITGCMREGHSP